MFERIRAAVTGTLGRGTEGFGGGPHLDGFAIVFLNEIGRYLYKSAKKFTRPRMFYPPLIKRACYPPSVPL